MKKNLFFAHFVCKKCTFRLPDYSLDAKVFQEINMRCGGLKYILGQSDYRKYLQNGGAEGQEMLQKIIKTQQNPTSTNAKKSTQLIKDKSFKIE